MNAAFGARLADGLAVYERAYDPRFPVVCFEEWPCVLHGQPVEPLLPVPAQVALDGQRVKAGRPRRQSSPYVRQGTAGLLVTFEPGTGQRLGEVSVRRVSRPFGPGEGSPPPRPATPAPPCIISPRTKIPPRSR